MSGLTIPEVETWKPGGLTAIGADVETANTSFEQDMASVGRRAQDIPTYWKSSAGDDAVERAGREKRAGYNSSMAMVSLSETLTACAQELAAAKERVLSAVDAAKGAGCKVSPSGGVTPPAAPSPAKVATTLMSVVTNPVAGAVQAAENAKKAAAFQAEIKHALALAQEAAVRCGEKVAKCVQALHTQATSPDYGGFASANSQTDSKVTKYLNGKNLPTDPVALAALWSTFSAADKEALAAKFPWIGKLDGIPADEKDLYNRRYLPMLRNQLKKQIRLYEVRHGEGPNDGDPVLQQMKDKLDAIHSVETTLAQPGVHQLLLLDAHSGQQMHAAVSNGDVSTATNVATFVPGFTTNVQHSLGGYNQNMVHLQRLATREAARHGNGGSVATVTWFGYDAPQTSQVLDPSRTTMDAALAHAGAGPLASFLTGIHATHPPGLHSTVLGHSYGSLVTGLALQHKGTGVQNAIVFGSPGLGTDNRADLHVPHLYAEEARGDAVPDLNQSMPGDHLIGVGSNVSDLPHVQWLGTQPAITPDGTHVSGSVWHTHYLDQNTDSQYNDALVVGGAGKHWMVRVPDQSVLGHTVQSGEYWVGQAGKSIWHWGESQLNHAAGALNRWAQNGGM